MKSQEKLDDEGRRLNLATRHKVVCALCALGAVVVIAACVWGAIVGHLNVGQAISMALMGLIGTLAPAGMVLIGPLVDAGLAGASISNPHIGRSARILDGKGRPYSDSNRQERAET